MKPLKSLLFVGTIILTFSSCCQVLRLCDLAVQGFTAPETIQVGQVANLIADVINEKDSGECETDIASLTTNLIEVFFYNTDIGDWESMKEFPVDQDAIAAGDNLEVLAQYTPPKPGDYRWDFYDDYPDNVEERNDNNNFACANCRAADKKEIMRATNNFRSAYTKVVE